MVARVDRISVQAAQVLAVQLEQRAGEVLGVAQVHSELVGLELVLAGDDVHAEFDEDVEGGQGIVEEEEADYDGARCVEAEGGVEGGV